MLSRASAVKREIEKAGNGVIGSLSHRVIGSIETKYGERNYITSEIQKTPKPAPLDKHERLDTIM